NGPASAGRPPSAVPMGSGLLRAPAQRVRIIADKATNSLLVKASPLDFLVIQKLIRNELDGDTRSEPPPWRLKVILLKNGPAAEVANVVREVYGDVINKSFTIGVDGRTNSVVIRCSPALDADIQALVHELDRKQ